VLGFEFTSKAAQLQGDSEGLTARTSVKFWDLVVREALSSGTAVLNQEGPSEKKLLDRIHRIFVRDYARAGGAVR
jgi:hypothetical protein